MLRYFLKGWMLVLFVIGLIAGFCVGSFLLFELWHPAIFLEGAAIFLVCVGFLIFTSYGSWEDRHER